MIPHTPHPTSKPYNNSRIEYWSLLLKFSGFFLIGYVISRTDMIRHIPTESKIQQ